ncbi:hypothetical protein A3759_27605, partial [Thalassolituus sp. HI0120]
NYMCASCFMEVRMGTRGIGNKDGLNSKARISIINTFFPLGLHWDLSGTSQPKAIFDHQEFIELGGGGVVKERFVKSMPMLIQGDGAPWDLGNLYLICLFQKKIAMQNLHMGTIKSHAECLLHYLRWIEHSQHSNPAFNALYLPENESMRVTYRYRRYLMSLIQKRIISAGTANKRIAAIVSFYKMLISEQLINPIDVEHLPYQVVIKTIMMTNKVGLRRIAEIGSSDLAIQVPKAVVRAELVNDDGEKLRPLCEKEQELILDELSLSGSRVHQLIFWMALFTGARIQTIGTLRICSLKEAYESQAHKAEVLLKVGPGTMIDTKGNKNYVLHVPTILVEKLLEYINSTVAKEARLKSFYGDTLNNYVFLTGAGQPYYTSRLEMEDRQSSEYSTRLTLKERVNFTPKTGQAIRTKVNELIKVLRENNVEFRSFRFHDLRASFAMNFLIDS